MSTENAEAVVEIIRNCFQTRNFGPMVDLFIDDGVYETPYAFENNRNEGIEAIRKRFDQVTNSVWNKLVQIDTVTVKTIATEEPSTVFVEFFISGVRKSDGVAFDFPSSVAIIQIRSGRIVEYRDFPNVLGIAKSAGILEQFAQTLKG